MPSSLPTPKPGRSAAEAFVTEHMAHLVCDDVRGSDGYSGGQSAADAALADFNVGGYAATRHEVWPAPRRGASGLSPYIRHGLITLEDAWDRVADGPSEDVGKFREELLWQEFARHWYARVGADSAKSMRHDLPNSQGQAPHGPVTWDRSMACLEMCAEELEDDGWLVNQTRMWLSSHWTLREGGRWQDGENEFFRHLLDGSRAANRMGWQWTTGAGSAKHYGFSRWQVEKRAPGLCGQCERSGDCPIEQWPADPELVKREPLPWIRRALDPKSDAGPETVQRIGTPDVVWLTAESLGAEEPALAANPNLPVVFVFDEALLLKLQLSSKRLVFLVETLAELGLRRDVQLHLGAPAELLTVHTPAVTFAPVPGFERISSSIELGEIHPYPWLSRPTGASVSSFSAWRKTVKC